MAEMRDVEFAGEMNDDKTEREIKRRKHAGPLPQNIYNLLVQSHTFEKRTGNSCGPRGPQLKSAGFPKPTAGKTRRETFTNWLSRTELQYDPVTMAETLVHQRTRKIIVPLEQFESVIKKEHENPDGSHKSFKSTLDAVKKKYTMSNRDFGMNKSIIAYVVQSCLKCSDKKLGLRNKMASSVTNGTKQKPDDMEKALVHPDDGVPMAGSLSMVAHIPDSACVWYDKSVLHEQKFYPALQRLVTELRGEVPAIARGSTEARNRLQLKLFILKKFIREKKDSIHKTIKVSEPFDQSFHDQVKELVTLYNTVGKSDKECKEDMRTLVNFYKAEGYSELFLQSLEASIYLAMNPTNKNSSDQLLGLENGPALDVSLGMIDAESSDQSLGLKNGPTLDVSVGMIDAESSEQSLGLENGPALDISVGMIDAESSDKSLGLENGLALDVSLGMIEAESSEQSLGQSSDQSLGLENGPALDISVGMIEAESSDQSLGLENGPALDVNVGMIEAESSDKSREEATG